MSALRLRFGTLEKILVERPGATEWEVAVDGEGKARAISYTGLTEELAPGDPVALNTAAVALGLGTGGLHFVVARLRRQLAGAREAGGDQFEGPEAGHVLKLRYTPPTKTCAVRPFKFSGTAK